MKKKRYKIEISDEAELDFDKSYEFYASKSDKAANDF
jgi:toxin ParE1/3/4